MQKALQLEVLEDELRACLWNTVAKGLWFRTRGWADVWRLLAP